MKSFFLTVSELAHVFQASRDTVRKRLAGERVKAKQVGRREVYELRAATEAITGAGEGTPFDRKARAQTEMIEMQIAERAGRLLRRVDVELEMSRIAKLTVQVLETIPDVLEMNGLGDKRQLDLIDDHIADLRERLYKKIVDDAAAKAAAA